MSRIRTVHDFPDFEDVEGDIDDLLRDLFGEDDIQWIFDEIVDSAMRRIDEIQGEDA